MLLVVVEREPGRLSFLIPPHGQGQQSTARSSLQIFLYDKHDYKLQNGASAGKQISLSNEYGIILQADMFKEMRTMSTVTIDLEEY